MVISTREAGPVSTSESPPARWQTLEHGVEIHQPAWTEQAWRILSDGALQLVSEMQREFGEERLALLTARESRQKAWDAGELPSFLSDEEAGAARGEWRVADLPEDLLQRRVEITGPINDTKMVINMLSRGGDGARADAAMLDFEDSMKPSWANVLQGVENLIGAADGTLSFVKPGAGGEAEKRYSIDPEDMPLLMARCRGLHLDESNLRVDGQTVSGGLLDLTLSAFHTAKILLSQGKTPKYYVPKVEHYLEAGWWDRLFTRLEERLGLPLSTLRATFLMETLPAAFQMEEILYQLRRHAAGLNVGRWDKIFSDIKVLRNHPDRVLADRGSISLNRPWMRNYAERLIKICHRHGAFAMGGMAAFTPGRSAELRQQQTRKVVEDKELESSLGHDGCWVSHPYFISPAMAAFPHRNQLDRMPEIEEYPDLLPTGTPPRTLDGLRKNVRVGIAYVKGWNQDIGCVAWDDLMEDLATLEISRAQTWQWLRHAVALDDGTRVTRDLVHTIFDEELKGIEEEITELMEGLSEEAISSEIDLYREARRNAAEIFTESDFRPFLSRASELVE